MNSKNTLVKLLTPDEFFRAIEAIATDYHSLAVRVVATLDANPDWRKSILEKRRCADVLDRLERLGRGQLHPQIAMAGYPAVEKLMLLPLSEQTAAIRDGVEVLDMDESTTRIIPVDELTSKQCSQAFTRGKVRSLAEQRTWIRDKKAKVAPINAKVEFRIGRDGVRHPQLGFIPKALIHQWVVEMG